MKMLSPAALLAALALAAQLRTEAQPPTATSPDAPARYDVEIIVFAYRDFDRTEERFPAPIASLPGDATEGLLPAPVLDESTLALLASPPVSSAPGIVPSEPSPPIEGPLTVRPLRGEELKLHNEYRKLQAIPAYVPLLHVGWAQPGLPEGDAQSVDLGTLGIPNPRGTVRVHLSRFLHVTLDLTYQADSAVPAITSFDGELGEIDVPFRYRLSATRNVRSGELHYFDHPAFGVLVLVTPRSVPGNQPGRRPAA